MLFTIVTIIIIFIYLVIDIGLVFFKNRFIHRFSFGQVQNMASLAFAKYTCL